MKKKEEMIVPPETQKPTGELAGVEKGYRRGIFILRWIPRLKNSALALWAMVDLLLIIIFVIVVLGYFVAGSFVDKRQISQIGNNVSLLQSIGVNHSAQNAVAGDVQAFSVGTDLYDLYVELENPNIEWYASFTYHFNSSAGESEYYEGFLLPNESRPLLALHQTFETRPSRIDLVVDDFEWMRVDADAGLDMEAWLEERGRFDVSETSYNFDIEIEESRLPRTSFTITNASPYSYYAPEFFILLKQGTSIVGVNQVTVPSFETSETRQVNVNWFGSVPSSGDVTIIPNINYFDLEEYQALPSEVEGDVRDEVSDRRR
jgi:hypothetical protein